MHSDFDRVENNNDGKDSDATHPQVAIVAVAIDGTGVDYLQDQKCSNNSKSHSLHYPKCTNFKVKDLIIFTYIVKLRKLPS
jgi:hypothetical protein